MNPLARKVRSTGANPMTVSSFFYAGRPEIVIERHAAADDGVLLPLRCPPGEIELRFENLLE